MTLPEAATFDIITARRMRAGAVVLVVMLVHAAVLTSLEAPLEPSGRGRAVVASALTVRQVAVEATVPAARVEALPVADVVATAPAMLAVLVGPPHVPIAVVKPAPAPRAVAASASTPRREAPLHKAAPPEAKPQPHRVTSEAASSAADSTDGEAGSSAADALLPAHLLRSLPTYAVRLPPSQRLHFRVTRGAARGEGTLDWALHDDGRYSAALRLRGEGMPGVDWTSEGDAAGDAGVLPRRMVAHRKGRAVATANFALDEQKVSFTNARVERPFVRGGQDRLTWMLQLAGVLEARQAPLRDDERIVLYVVGPRGAADLWQWRVAGRETLGEGAAAVPAVKLVREAQRLYDTEIELWLDPVHHHLPLKWRQQQRGVEQPALEWERVDPQRGPAS